jgi:hypothetical protein
MKWDAASILRRAHHDSAQILKLYRPRVDDHEKENP